MGECPRLTEPPPDLCLQESERFILMDRVPQQVYGRMRMCRAMVNDHFTPAYLSAMASAVALFEAGYPAQHKPFDSPRARGGWTEADATRSADAGMGGQEFQTLERSGSGAEAPAASKGIVGGLASHDTRLDGHVKAA